MKYVICHSGGVSSGECALSVANKYGSENVILLNHNINGKVESASTKKFKADIANYLGIDITYANHKDWETATPISVCVEAKAWKVAKGGKIGDVLCTNRLKTEPFQRWMDKNDQEKENIYVYGFDLSEPTRITRRSQIMGSNGFKTAYPMIWDESEIVRISDVGIDKPAIYDKFKHSNCIGCLKAGWQHWYIVYCTRKDIWEDAKKGEDEIGYAIHKDTNGPVYLEDKEELFNAMVAAGVEPTENVKQQTFWAQAKKKVKNHQKDMSDLEQHDKGVCLECMA